ncbi:MAG: hypothetical protein P0Y48_01350 [Candidatus Microbacterium phytovorans]|uniref:Uncharacterized protein n=1 Tax=Candidatus Microbacterium phytovorans TaxID=3121374 RepID=A0AAJ5W0K0_9MICO|nr:hypothetical protein [Microbacterium sp.]WEK13886.1 MAG: hypothetical protein P0Y48_01350 [Microbacterium sp.]
MARTIRVAGVPADFRVPRGWPVPTDRWIRTNAFWVPPADWTPTTHLRPAPRGWRFWQPNPLWSQSQAQLYRRARIWLYAGFTLMLLGVGSRILGSVTRDDAFALLSFALLGVALASYIVHAVVWARITRGTLQRFAEIAEESRRRYLTREYQRYLLDAG